MKIGKRKIRTTTIALLIAVCMLTTVLAVLLYSKSFDVSITVKAHGFKLYQDEACTTELTAITLTDIDVNNIKYTEFWVKNVGSQDMVFCYNASITSPIGYTLEGNDAYKILIKDGSGVEIGYLHLDRYVGTPTPSWKAWNSEFSDLPYYQPIAGNTLFTSRFTIFFNQNTENEGLTCGLTVNINAYDVAP